MKDIVVRFRCSAEERDEMFQLARAAGLEFSDWARCRLLPIVDYAMDAELTPLRPTMLGGGIRRHAQNCPCDSCKGK